MTSSVGACLARQNDARPVVDSEDRGDDCAKRHGHDYGLRLPQMLPTAATPNTIANTVLMAAMRTW